MNTTPRRAAGEAMPTNASVCDAVGKLEVPLQDAMNMARIAALLVEDSITDYKMIGGSRRVSLDDNRAEAVTWAVYQTETLFKAVVAAWDDVNATASDTRRAS